jgi:hypothetical protein
MMVGAPGHSAIPRRCRIPPAMYSTYGLGGHGLLLSPAPHTRAVVAGEELVLVHGFEEVARIKPGMQPATKAPTRDGRTLVFGDTGPVLRLAEHVELDDVLLRIDTGLGPGSWVAIARGFLCELSPNVLLIGAQPGDEDPYFELHLVGGREELIAFQPRAVGAHHIRIAPGPGQTVVGQGEIEGGAGVIAYTELGYNLEGTTWRQLTFAVPIAARATVVVTAQAMESHRAKLFAAALRTATSLVALA